jgi:NADH pyrophosphatase NudC (nudix superfamily)
MILHQRLEAQRRIRQSRLLETEQQRGRQMYRAIRGWIEEAQQQQETLEEAKIRE